MTLKSADRVLESSTTQGTGTINLAGPATGFRSFVAAVGTGQKVPYVIDDGTDWEVGVGTVTSGSPDTLARTTVLASSNANAAVNWGPGTRNVRLSPLAPVVLQRDENLNFIDFNATGGGTANAHTITMSPAPLAYSTGMLVYYKATVANTSGTVTANVNSIAAKNIKKYIGGSLVALGIGEIQIGTPMMLFYDGTDLLWLNPPTFSKGADIASSATLVLTAATGDLIDVTGTTGITAVTLNEGQQVMTRFTGVLTITVGASLILQGGANYTTTAGDIILWRGYGSGVVRGIVFPIGGYARLDANQNFTKAQRGTPVSLTQAATIAVDLSLGNNFYTTMTGNRTLGQPTNFAPGQGGTIEIIQDGTGTRTLAFHADWLFPGGTDPVLSTAIGAVDLLCYQVNQAGTKVFANLLKGFA